MRVVPSSPSHQSTDAGTVGNPIRRLEQEMNKRRLHPHRTRNEQETLASSPPWLWGDLQTKRLIETYHCRCQWDCIWRRPGDDLELRYRQLLATRQNLGFQKRSEVYLLLKEVDHDLKFPMFVNFSPGSHSSNRSYCRKTSKFQTNHYMRGHLNNLCTKLCKLASEILLLGNPFGAIEARDRFRL